MYIYQTMSNSFGYLDIILLGMIAGFIILWPENNEKVVKLEYKWKKSCDIVKLSQWMIVEEKRFKSGKCYKVLKCFAIWQ